MYYGHLNNPNFTPTIMGIIRKGRGYSVHLVNTITKYDRNLPLSEFKALLNCLGQGYYIKLEVLTALNSFNVNTFILGEIVFRINSDIKKGICKVI